MSEPKPPLDSVFTPFFRRFTDERADDLERLRVLYAEVRKMHLASPYADEKAYIHASQDVYATFVNRIPEPLQGRFCGVLGALTRMEKTIFTFPEIKWDVEQLSLKEQVDLERFLTSKRHFLTHHEKVISLFQEGLHDIFEAIFNELPQLETPSPFTIPFYHVHPEPKKMLLALYSIVWRDRYIENAVFVDLGHELNENICAVSKIADKTNPTNKPYLIPTENKAPIAELVEGYLHDTALYHLITADVPLRLTYEDRFSHMHVVGGSGAGKTQLLQHLILNDLMAENPPALIIVDSQSDLIGKISRLALFEDRLKDKLILITPRDTKFPPALNIFDVNRKRIGQYDEETKEQVTAGVIQTFDYLFNGLLGADLSAKQGVFFRFVARLLLALPETMGRNATILDMINLMDDPAPYQKTIESLPPIQRNFFERDFKSTTFKQTREQIRYRLNAILENPTLARLFTSERTKIDLFTEINNGSIILVDTAKDFLKGSSANFGRIFISLVLQAILERAAIPEDERTPAFLVVDEAAAYFDSNMDDLLTEARKYKLGCVFAHQFLDQATSSLKSSLAANTAIKMCSGISTNDARQLAPDLRTTPEFILSQPRLTFAAHIRNVTPQAISLPIPYGEMEKQPRLSQEAYDDMREANRRRVSITATDPPRSPSAPLTQPPLSPDDPGTGTSTEW